MEKKTINSNIVFTQENHAFMKQYAQDKNISLARAINLACDNFRNSLQGKTESFGDRIINFFLG